MQSSAKLRCVMRGQRACVHARARRMARSLPGERGPGQLRRRALRQQLPQRAPARLSAPYWLAAEAGDIGAGVLLVDGVVGDIGASAGRFSHPANPENAATAATITTGIAILDFVMVISCE